MIWECSGLSANVVASPVAADGMVYAGSSYDTRALLAISVWTAPGAISQEPLRSCGRARATHRMCRHRCFMETLLYFLAHYRGILSRVHAKTGQDRPGAFRLPGIRNVYASPVGASDRVYLTDRSGTTLVISHESRPLVLARNHLNDSFSASAARWWAENFSCGGSEVSIALPKSSAVHSFVPPPFGGCLG